MVEPYFTPTPKWVGVEITNRCNLFCKHCFNRSGGGSIQELALADLLSLFDQVLEMGVTTTRISGGEPTLHPDFAAIVTKAHQRGLQVSINSHGLYPAAVREQIANLPIDLFIISLDGLREANDFFRGKGVFDRAVDTVAWLRSLGRSVVLGVHLARSNVADVEGLIALAAELALPHRVKSGPFRQSEIGIQALEERIDQLKGTASTGDEEQSQDEQDKETAKKKVSTPISNLAKNPQDPSP